MSPPRPYDHLVNQQPAFSARGAQRPQPPEPGRAGPRIRPWWAFLLACADIVVLIAFLWTVEHTSQPPLPGLVVLLVALIAVLVGPWAWLAARRLGGEAAAGHILRRVLIAAGALAGAGVAVAAAAAGYSGKDPEAAGSVAMLAILVAGAVTLVGLVVLPWLFLLTRTLARERAARVRAEERAQTATHLHDSVLQTLTLIQKRSGDPGEMARLARHAERELRGWLYGPAADPGGQDDLVSALRAAAGEVEDRFGISVELVTVGTCRLDQPARAVVAAAGEALVNAAKHAGVAQVSLFAEVAEGEVLVAVRDRGRGFDSPAATMGGHHGIAESIVGRVSRQGGTATIHTTPGVGTEVELRLPASRP
jgi:signal transduction histidine kinase